MSKFKVGDLVRVPGMQTCKTWHGFHPGQVVEVIGTDLGYSGQVEMYGELRMGGHAAQGLHGRHLKSAKQAMRKRAAALHSQSV